MLITNNIKFMDDILLTALVYLYSLFFIRLFYVILILNVDVLKGNILRIYIMDIQITYVVTLENI